MTHRLWPRASALTLSLLAAGCKDSNGPESYNPMATSQTAAQAYGAVQNNKAVQSLDVLGSAFTLTGATAPLPFPAPAPDYSAFRTVPPELLNTLQRLERLATTFSAASPQDLFPSTVRGKTFVYNPQTARYAPSDRTGAPANGVRFMLYAVDPVLKRVVTPLQEVGYLDLTDKGSNTLGIKAVITSVTPNVTALEYDATGAIGTSGFTFSAKGYVSDGTTRLDFDLSLSLAAATGLKIDYKITQQAKNLSIHVVATGTTSNTGNVTLTITEGSNNLEVAAIGTNTSVSGTIKYNGSTVATISGKPENPVFTGANGKVLTADDLIGLKNLFDFVDKLFDGFDDLLLPAFFVFGISA